ARAVDAIAEAAAGNADMIVFPETWLAGYPYWTEGWDSPLDTWVQTRIRFRDAAVMVGDESCHSLGEAAARHEIHVVMGVNELDDTVGSDTIYNSQFFFDRQGVLYGRRRKLMPTFIERVFWGRGTADDVRVFDTDVGRVGGLICGEHLMPLVRGAMVELGERSEEHTSELQSRFDLHSCPTRRSSDLFAVLLRQTGCVVRTATQADADIHRTRVLGAWYGRRRPGLRHRCRSGRRSDLRRAPHAIGAGSHGRARG